MPHILLEMYVNFVIMPTGGWGIDIKKIPPYAKMEYRRNIS
jgi:hypothetical protein